MSEIKTTVLVMKLARPARKSGGDRYEGKTPEGEDLTLYFPQSISRATTAGVTPAQELHVEISHG